MLICLVLGENTCKSNLFKSRGAAQMKLGETFLSFHILVIKWTCILTKAEVSFFLFFLPLLHTANALSALLSLWLHTSSPPPPSATSALHPVCRVCMYKGEFWFWSFKNPTLFSIYLPLRIKVVYITWLRKGNQLFFWTKKTRELKASCVKFGLCLKNFFLYHSSFPSEVLSFAICTLTGGWDLAMCEVG